MTRVPTKSSVKMPLHFAPHRVPSGKPMPTPTNQPDSQLSTKKLSTDRSKAPSPHPSTQASPVFLKTPKTLTTLKTLTPLALLTTLTTLTIPAAPLHAQQLSPTAAAQETAAFLADLVKLDTQDPPGNESQVANYLAAVLTREHIPYQLLEPVPGRASIVARLKGTGAKKPILLMAHEDVVPVNRAQWTFDPFAATIKDHILYGRGASDDKSPLAAHLETLLQLKRSGKPLSRDIIFLAEASEETSSPAGMNTLVNKFWPQLACEFALNEGGAAEVDASGNIAYFGIATGEKLPRPVLLTAKGHGGHGSVPVTDNAITHLAAAVAKLGSWQTPTRLNDTTRTFFAGLATLAPPAQAALFRAIDAPATQPLLHQQLPAFYSMIHTSVVPTLFQAGFKLNVIPTDAEAQLDIRALPDEDLPAFYNTMRALIDDPLVTLTPTDLADTMPAAPTSSIHTAMYDALTAAQQQLLPHAITLPVMSTGATDSSFLRAKGVNAYGLRIPRTFAMNAGVHGNDERIDLRYVALYQQLVQTAVEAVSR